MCHNQDPVQTHKRSRLGAAVLASMPIRQLVVLLLVTASPGVRTIKAHSWQLMRYNFPLRTLLDLCIQVYPVLPSALKLCLLVAAAQVVSRVHGCSDPAQQLQFQGQAQGRHILEASCHFPGVAQFQPLHLWSLLSVIS